jgi:hypothetical protein
MKGNRWTFLVLLFAAFVFGVVANASAADPDWSNLAPKGVGKSVMDWDVGVTKYDQKKAYKGFTLWASMGQKGKVYLMDMKGKVVHSWRMPTPPGNYGFLLENGNLLYAGRTKTGHGGKTHHMSGKGGVIYERTWDNKSVVKLYQPHQHHDFDKMPNGNYVLILWEPLSKGKRSRVRGGVPGTEHSDGWIFEEKIVEVDPNNNVVWEWLPSEHLEFKDYPVGPLEDRLEWLHANSLDYLPAGNPITGKEGVMISLRHPSACIIVDKATGEVVWRYGGFMEGEWGRLGAQHDFQMIPEDLPGGGNILIFDNGQHLPSVKASNSYWGFAHSRILEISPRSKRVLWEYDHRDPEWKFPIQRKWKFSAPFISGAQRLPNGNTLICDGPSGRIFEVTKKKEIVWEFINPEQKGIFRAYRYGPDFPAFKGKNLPNPR